jgi:hypothetical protein
MKVKSKVNLAKRVLAVAISFYGVFQVWTRLMIQKDRNM